jgi:glucose/arabinose dehydrogenase
MENNKILKNFMLIMVFSLTISLSIFATVSSSRANPDSPIVGGSPQKVEDHFIAEPEEYMVESWIENLRIPWELIFLSDEKALVTERAGSVRLIENGVLQEKPYKIIDEVEHIGEGGLMGLAKHPDYPLQRYLYAMYTYRENGALYSRVARYIDSGDSMEFDRPIIEKIPASNVHNGGRIAFGPDGMLYITTGDTWHSEIAQNIDILGGKILRLTAEGDIPSDNPFPDSPVYSFGHRNPQGLAWHPETGMLFASEHGPSGEFGLYSRDEINIIEKGGNYGWPQLVGAAGVEPYKDPIIMWIQTTPPSGMAFWNGYLFVATLRSEALIRIEIRQRDNAYKIRGIDRLFAYDWSGGTYGRLRDAVVGSDNALYVLTNNYDGRGWPYEGDDKILRLTLK